MYYDLCTHVNVNIILLSLYGPSVTELPKINFCSQL